MLKAQETKKQANDKRAMGAVSHREKIDL